LSNLMQDEDVVTCKQLMSALGMHRLHRVKDNFAYPTKAGKSGKDLGRLGHVQSC